MNEAVKYDKMLAGFMMRIETGCERMQWMRSVEDG